MISSVNNIVKNSKLIDNTYVDIIYFRSSIANLTPEILLNLEQDALCKIHLCDSWNLLMAEINTFSSTGVNLPLVLVDANIFDQKNATINEMVNMILTMNRCLKTPFDLTIGVVIESTCCVDKFKTLHDSTILGAVPCVDLLGYEETLFALKELIIHKSHWAKKTIESIVGVTPKKSRATGIVLTNRQTQVLKLVCNRGLSNKKIALALGITESTVKIHISAILKEYGVRNRTQLALAANYSLKA
jgi:DNA-binding CsgD family transcriptional regulator